MIYIGHLPCLRLIRKIVYDMEAENADRYNTRSKQIVSTDV